PAHHHACSRPRPARGRAAKEERAKVTCAYISRTGAESRRLEQASAGNRWGSRPPLRRARQPGVVALQLLRGARERITVEQAGTPSASSSVNELGQASRRHRLYGASTRSSCSKIIGKSLRRARRSHVIRFAICRTAHITPNPTASQSTDPVEIAAGTSPAPAMTATINRTVKPGHTHLVGPVQPTLVITCEPTDVSSTVPIRPMPEAYLPLM